MYILIVLSQIVLLNIVLLNIVLSKQMYQQTCVNMEELKTLNIMQLNAQGMSAKASQGTKIPIINKVIDENQIDIVLLQEWSIRRINNINPSNENYWNEDENAWNDIHFPIESFPEFNVSFTNSNVAIMYKKELDIITFNEIHTGNNKYNKDELHYLVLLCKYQGKEITIINFYNSQTSDLSDLFKTNWQSDHILAAGDANIKHELWGNPSSSTRAIDFVNFLNYGFNNYSIYIKLTLRFINSLFWDKK